MAIRDEMTVLRELSDARIEARRLRSAAQRAELLAQALEREAKKIAAVKPVIEEARYGPCASCGEPTYGLRHARCEAERDARLAAELHARGMVRGDWPHNVSEREKLEIEAELREEIPAAERCGECGIREAHYTGGPCTYCWHRHFDREDY